MTRPEKIQNFLDLFGQWDPSLLLVMAVIGWLKYEELTHTSASQLDPERTLVIATFSPLEVHGPHLPLGQDVFEAYHLATRARRDGRAFAKRLYKTYLNGGAK